MFQTERSRESFKDLYLLYLTREVTSRPDNYEPLINDSYANQIIRFLQLMLSEYAVLSNDNLRPEFLILLYRQYNNFSIIRSNSVSNC